MDDAIREVDALTVRKLQHELRKRGLLVSGVKEDLRKRVIKALQSEYSDGWTRGYLLNTKIVPFNGRGRDPQTLVGRFVTELGETEDNSMAIMLADGEEAIIVFQASDADNLDFWIDDELFDLFFTSSYEHRTYGKKPLLVTEAATGVRKNYQGVVAATVLGIKLAGMKEMAFFNIPDCDDFDNIPDGYESWSKLGADVWLAADGKVELEGESLRSKNKAVVQDSTNSLLAGKYTPIKNEGFEDCMVWHRHIPQRCENLVPEEDDDE